MNSYQIPILAGIVLLCYLYLICPALRRHPDRDLLHGLRIAHRGLHDRKTGVVENTASAFEEAARAGYAIETDIHLTRDGDIVVFHDDTLQRLCGDSRHVRTMTLPELQQQHLHGTGERMLSFSEFLQLVDGRVPLLIEFKCDHRDTFPLCRKAEAALSHYSGKYFVQSFCPLVGLWYRFHRPKICRGQLADGTHSGDGHRFLRFCNAFLLANFLARPDFVSYNVLYAGNLSRRLNTAFGVIPVCWTVGSEALLNHSEKRFRAFIFEGFRPKLK